MEEAKKLETINDKEGRTSSLYRISYFPALYNQEGKYHGHSENQTFYVKDLSFSGQVHVYWYISVPDHKPIGIFRNLGFDVNEGAEITEIWYKNVF